MRAVPASRYLVFFTIAVLGCLADLVSKTWAFDRLGMPGVRVEWLWSGYIGIETSLNEGALFGMGQGRGFWFAGLSVVAVAGIFYWLFIARAAVDWLLTIALGCVTGGVFGNLYDRLGLHGLTWAMHRDPARIGQPVYAVRDWILLQAGEQWRWPNFNIADSLLVSGAALLCWHAYRGHPPATEG